MGTGHQGQSAQDLETYSLVPFKKNHPSPFIASSQIVPGMVKLDGGDDISYEPMLAPATNTSHDRARAVLPSVISSTSPLSPKHLD